MKPGSQSRAGVYARDRVYEAIVDHVKRRGYPPTLRWLARELMMSTTNVKHHLDGLVADGRIERDPFISRGIRVVE